MMMGNKLLLKEYYSLCPDGICNISVLNEAEKRLKNDGYYILTGILQSANKKNGNGRVYNRRILEREIRNYQKVINERRSIGECDHPDDSIVNLRNASHMVLRTWWDGDDVWGTIKVLKHTPAGQTLEGLLKDKVQLGVSSRGLGSLQETPRGSIVQEDFQLICFDMVSEPSTPNAYMIPENKIRQLTTKGDRLNRLLNEICEG